jgi:5-methylcytosine-specific restriction endonuclease McrA
MKGDAHRQWARWYTESLFDPRASSLAKADYATIFEHVFRAIEHVFGNQQTRPEMVEMATVAARAIDNTARIKRGQASRRPYSISDRQLLISLAGSPPRCWVCGYVFQEDIVDAFSCQGKCTPKIDPFIDILRPRGLNDRDYAIEIDHVVPVSKGGSEADNLRLACGWCNNMKTSHSSIYDVEGQPRPAPPNAFGLTSLPQPFWVIRTLATTRACEHSGGCGCTTGNSSLTVAPIIAAGALNPVNLRVTCVEHDPLGILRLQPPSAVKALWRQRPL